MPEAARDKPLEIWFRGTRRGSASKGILTRIWARRGTRPRAPRDTRYEWAYIFSAVCPARGAAAGLVLPFADTEAMNAHLAEIARTVAPGAHAVLLLDGAGWYRGGELVVPENISLLKLPPYSPELNPDENVWRSSAPTGSPSASSTITLPCRCLLRCLEASHNGSRLGGGGNWWAA